MVNEEWHGGIRASNHRHSSGFLTGWMIGAIDVKMLKWSKARDSVEVDDESCFDVKSR
jgi:hypothetical protein